MGDSLHLMSELDVLNGLLKRYISGKEFRPVAFYLLGK